MIITKKIDKKEEEYVVHILKVNEDSFSIGGYYSISLRNKKDLTLLTRLHFDAPDHFG